MSRLSAVSVLVDWVRIQYADGNSGNIAIGDSVIQVGATARRGIQLLAGQEGGVLIPGPCDLLNLHVHGSATGDQVHFTYEERS
jgi:hypothetical protein